MHRAQRHAGPAGAAGSLAGCSHPYLGWVVDVIERLRARDAADLPVFVVGTIPESDDAELRRLGVSGIYRPGLPPAAVVGDVTRVIAAVRAGAAPAQVRGGA